jgi:hypothetical protein
MMLFSRAARVLASSSLRVVQRGLLFAYFLSLAWPTPVAAASVAPFQLDWVVPGGHHFTEANGFPTGTSPAGFAIVDDDRAKLWTAFQANGGVERLGYPASQRFLWRGFVTQVTQKAVLQWRPESNTVDFVNVFDDMDHVGLDDWLWTVRAVPRPITATNDSGLTWPAIVEKHVNLLASRPAILQKYRAAADPLDLYGLPVSPVVDAGPMYVVRLQRAVLQEWKVAEPWANVGEVTVANGGDVAKEAGAFPADAMRPASPPVDTWPTMAYAMSGIATWYGPGFAGKAMANGHIYQPNDPTTTASNAYPLGSLLRVTALSTKKSIQVDVRDTGGFGYPHVVDLSPAAFVLLGDPLATGVISVTVDLVTPPGATSPVTTSVPLNPVVSPSPTAGTTSNTHAPSRP